jgi:excisionase family DNA binding protein
MQGERKKASNGGTAEPDATAGPFAALDRHLADAGPEQVPGLALALAARLTMLASALSGKMELRGSDDDRDENLTVDEAAQRLGISKDYLYRHDLPFKVRIGRRVLFSAQGLSRWLDEQQR